MSNPEMKGARILRFHTSDKVFHSINAICWYALVITGAIVYFGRWVLPSLARPFSTGSSSLTFGAASLLPLWLHALIFLWLSCPWNISRAFGESVPATSLTKPLNITLRHGSNVTSSKLLKNNP